MARLANYLANVRTIGRPVLDRTGLEGSYGFSLDYATKHADDRPEATTAVQQQLGLRLEPVKVSIEIFIVDRVHKPTEN
jgi:uncharacterized protein (TIGR03435 family)